MQLKGQLEKKLRTEGYQVYGIDEVGRGCLAGPVYAACVSLNEDFFRLEEKYLKLIRDSKTLSSRQRSVAKTIIDDYSIYQKVASATVAEIDEFNILQAALLAMRRSLPIKIQNPYFLVDGNKRIPGISIQQDAIIAGDKMIFAISAASIIAKIARDTLMEEYSEKYPGYGFESNAGYGTKKHLTALGSIGLTGIHRKSFAPVRNLV